GCAARCRGGGGGARRGGGGVLRGGSRGVASVRRGPGGGVVRGGLPPKGRARVLAEPGRQYALYLHGGPRADLALALPPGRYRAEWLDPITGPGLKAGAGPAARPATELPLPNFDPHVALRGLRAEAAVRAFPFPGRCAAM